MPPVDSHTPVFEVCVDDPAGLADAIAGGADRIELCAALALGGLTPAPGLIEQAAETDVPIFAMIRPRPGGFLYSADELDAARRDIRAVRQAGLAGIVFGATDTTGRLDRDAIQQLRDAAGDLPMVLHRAFDVTPDPAEALETAIDLGFVRILTSGGAATAPEGVDALAALVRQAAGRIAIMAGGGVDAASVAPLLAAGVHDLHGSCSEVLADTGPVGRLRIAPTRAQTSVTKVRDMRRAIDAATMEQPA
ncbi:MAG: copper homeostasis protein CutC [Paracoccus denitrificans]|nr:MAG: copper homeostasis protein CutC [Paracoccus denitrificans]PZO84869.1 MAG: copper homeostasis protein CutC [Paracoccus denitrificans]